MEAVLQTLQQGYGLQFSPGSYVCLPEEVIAQVEQQLRERYGEAIFRQVDYFAREG